MFPFCDGSQVHWQPYYKLSSGAVIWYRVLKTLTGKFQEVTLKVVGKEIWPPSNAGVYCSKCSAGESCGFLKWQLQGLLQTKWSVQ
jgi:hypothetical protein